MKKILFLLLITVAGYSQTLQNPTFGTVKIMNSATVTTTPTLTTTEANGLQSKITPANLPVSTATQTALDLKQNISGVVVKTTISAIRALSGTLDYSNFYTTDIGKEGNWYYDSTDSTTADNTGTVLVTYDGKRIKRIFDDFVNIEWFGAIGDNSTDNTSFIQNALNTAEKVFVPKGTFISSNLTLQNKQTLSGTGELSVLKFKTGSTGYFINAETRDGILITNLLIDGGNISDYSAVSSIGTRSGLYFTATNQNLKVDKCKITGFNAIAIGYNGTTSSANESISVSNSNISKNYCGISTSPSGVTHDTSVSGGTGGEYSKIVGNTLNLNRYAVVTSAGNTNVVGNNMSGNGYGIYSTSVSNVGHGNIVSNEINHSLLYSVYMQDNTIGHVISGNALYFGDLYFENCSGIIFTGNQVNSNVLTITGTGTYQNFSNNYFLVVPTFTGDFSACLFSNNYGASGLFSGDFINNNSLVIDTAIRYGNAYNSVNNIVTNGTFATDTDWTKGTGWTISSGKANSTSSGTLSQSMTFVNGAYYVVEFDVSNFVSGNFRAGIGGITLSGFMSANGHKKLIIQKPLSGGNSLFSLVSTNFVGSIDNIVIYESLAKKLSVDNGIIISSETANTIASFDATKNVKSLSTSTYPSLTELAYVKGVTGTIQAQIDTMAPLANPTFIGVPTAPTAAPGTNTTQLATTAFVNGEIATIPIPTLDEVVSAGSVVEDEIISITDSGDGAHLDISYHGLDFRKVGNTATLQIEDTVGDDFIIKATSNSATNILHIADRIAGGDASYSFPPNKPGGTSYILTTTDDIPIQLKDFFSDVNNTSTTETDLQTYTIASNRLKSVGEKIISTYGGTFNDITATSQIKAYFAGTNIADTGALTMSVTGAWVVNASIIRTGTTTARAIVNISTPGASTAFYTKYTALTGLDFTTTNIIKITGTAAGATGGSNDITGVYGNVKWEPAAP